MSGPNLPGSQGLDPALHMRAGIAEMQDAIQAAADERIMSLDAEFGPGQVDTSQHGIIVNRKRARADRDSDDSDDSLATPKAKKLKQKAFYAWIGGLPSPIDPRPRMIMRPRRIVTPRGFDMLSSLSHIHELAVEIAKYLPYKDLLNVYVVNRAFKATIDAHLTSSLKTIADYRAPGSSSFFHWSKYPKLCIPDPMMRPQGPDTAITPGRSDNFDQGRNVARRVSQAKQVPTLRWLAMVLHRDRAVSDIMATMAGVNLRLPKEGMISLKKLWAFNELDTTVARRNLLADENSFNNQDLYLINVFVENLKNYVCDDSVVNAPWFLFLGLYNGMGLLARYMRRQAIRDMDAVFTYTTMYDSHMVTQGLLNDGYDEYFAHISGDHVLGRGHLEGFGKGPAHLYRIDELLGDELKRREHRLDADPACRALWDEMGLYPEAEELAITTEDGPVMPMSPEHKHARDERHPDSLRDVTPVHVMHANFHRLTPKEKMQLWKADNDERLKVLSHPEGEDDEPGQFYPIPEDWFDEQEAQYGMDIREQNIGADTPMQQFQAVGLSFFPARHQSLIRQAVRAVSAKVAQEERDMDEHIEMNGEGYQEGDDPEWEAEFERIGLQVKKEEEVEAARMHGVDKVMGLAPVGDNVVEDTTSEDGDVDQMEDDEQMEDDDDQFEDDDEANDADDEADSSPNDPMADIQSTSNQTTQNSTTLLQTTLPVPAASRPDDPPFDPREDPEYLFRGEMQNVTEMLHGMMVANRAHNGTTGFYGPESIPAVLDIVTRDGVPPELLESAEREILEEQEQMAHYHAPWRNGPPEWENRRGLRD